MDADAALHLIQRANAARRAAAARATAAHHALPAAARALAPWSPSAPAPTDDELALEREFACSEHLAVYGTLAPGRSNHHRLARCVGAWTAGAVHGRRGEREFPALTFDPAAPPVDVHLLHSEHLPRAWPELDDFEGPDYVRILVPVHAATGRVHVANLFEIVVPIAAP